MGTLRITENGAHTWVRGITLLDSVARLEKLGDVQPLLIPGGNKYRVTRFDGSVLRAEFFSVRERLRA